MFFGTQYDLLEEKSFSNILLVFLSALHILLISMLLSRSGGWEGDANFRLKCHVLCPICLTSFVVHFSTFIYVSILASMCTLIGICLIGVMTQNSDLWPVLGVAPMNLGGEVRGVAKESMFCCRQLAKL